MSRIRVVRVGSTPSADITEPFSRDNMNKSDLVPVLHGVERNVQNACYMFGSLKRQPQTCCQTPIDVYRKCFLVANALTDRAADYGSFPTAAWCEKYKSIGFRVRANENRCGGRKTEFGVLHICSLRRTPSRA